jgi:ring-1,2-phenylacetyl-CoA epoxidase subunit PaaD
VNGASMSVATTAASAKPASAGPLTARVEQAWRVLGEVLDPEVPALSVCDLGIVRDVIEQGEALDVVLTPTYSGCPATEVIEQSVREALDAAGLGPVRTILRRAPAWTTDWITPEGRRKLRDYGITPPGALPADEGVPLRFLGRSGQAQPLARAAVSCPRCGSAHTEQLSAFGSTACKAMYSCLDCREPFEYFKPI